MEEPLRGSTARGAASTSRPGDTQLQGPTPIVSGTITAEQQWPALVARGDTFTVAWTEGNTVSLKTLRILTAAE